MAPWAQRRRQRAAGVYRVIRRIDLAPALLGGALVALATGCGLDRSGTALGSTASGATGPVGSSGGGAGLEGGGAPAECQQPTDCPGQDEACRYRSCDGGHCGLEDAPAGRPCDANGGDQCDGLGQCLKALGTACTEPTECLSGFCVDTVCCAAPACGPADDCSVCNAAGLEGNCHDAASGAACDDAAYCNGTDTCDANGACFSHSGDPCGSNYGDADCTGTCDEGAGDCGGSEPNGSACSDGVYCNGTETCWGGSCGNSSGDPCAGNVGDCDSNCSESCNEPAKDCSANDPYGSLCWSGGSCNDYCDNGYCY